MFKAQLNQPAICSQYLSLKLPDDNLGGFWIQNLSSSTSHFFALSGRVKVIF